MSLPFDATLKELVRRFPLDWLAGLELDVDLPVRALDVDLSTVSADADTVLGIGDPLSSVVHIEFQSSRDPSLARRLFMYNESLNAISDIARLNRMGERVLDVATWQELLETP